MNSFLITYKPATENPKRGWPLEELLKLVRANQAGDEAIEPWRFRNLKDIKLGDRVFLLLQGKGGPAIIGYGEIAGQPERSSDGSIHKGGTRKESEEEFAKGMSYLERAIQEDSNYVPAYLELAANLLQPPVRQPHVDFSDKARVALNKALVLEETNVTTHLLMADYLFPNRSYDEPENHYKRVIQLNPNFAQGHEAYAEYLDDLGRFEEGMKEHQKAQELDPNTDFISSSPLTPLVVRLERRRKFMQMSVPLNDTDFWTRGEMEYELGQYAEALKDWEGVAREYGWNQAADAWVRAYAKGGPQALIRELRWGGLPQQIISTFCKIILVFRKLEQFYCSNGGLDLGLHKADWMEMG
jgi:tetratricopeptide (TPR) repeat protein